MRDRVGTINGRENSVCGRSGTTPNASTLGAISDPPADRKYAVDPGRRRDADAVGSDARDCAVVHSQPERNDAGDLALTHDDVVEREEPALAVLGFERGALVDEEPSLHERGQVAKVGVVLVELGEKAQASGVDAEERDVAFDRHARGAQQRSVAADRDQQRRGRCEPRRRSRRSPRHENPWRLWSRWRARARATCRRTGRRSSLKGRAWPSSFCPLRRATASSRASSNGCAAPPQLHQKLTVAGRSEQGRSGEGHAGRGRAPRRRRASRAARRGGPPGRAPRRRRPGVDRPASNCGLTSATTTPSLRK